MRARSIRLATHWALLMGAALALAALVACTPAGPSATGPQPRAGSQTTTNPAGAQPATVTAAPAKPAKRPRPKHSSASTGTASADSTLYEWNFHRNTTHTVPEIPTEALRLVKRYKAMYIGPDPKVVYLTFDEGYENGYTPTILDTLKRDGVHATFFVTGAYCREAPKLCKRMLAEGHVVGSHSDTHPSMPTLTSNPARFDAQLTGADAAFNKATGQHLAPFFRPPMGDYSAKSLAMTRSLGYTTVFWSFAHGDYDEKHQPPVPATISLVLSGSHPGAIFLLHAMSKSNTAALDAIIQGLRKQGYEFGTL